MERNPVGVARIGLRGEGKTEDAGRVVPNPCKLLPVSGQRRKQIEGIDIRSGAGGYGQLCISGNDDRNAGDLIHTGGGTRLIGRKRAHIPGGIYLNSDRLRTGNQTHHLNGICFGCRGDAGAANCIAVKRFQILCRFNGAQLPVAGLNLPECNSGQKNQEQAKREKRHFLHKHDLLFCLWIFRVKRISDGVLSAKLQKNTNVLYHEITEKTSPAAEKQIFYGQKTNILREKNRFGSSHE